MSNINNGSFYKGLGMGIVVGSAVSMAVKTGKNSKNAWGKALKSMGEVVDNISGVFGS